MRDDAKHGHLDLQLKDFSDELLTTAATRVLGPKPADLNEAWLTMARLIYPEWPTK